MLITTTVEGVIFPSVPDDASEAVVEEGTVHAGVVMVEILDEAAHENDRRLQTESSHGMKNV